MPELIHDHATACAHVVFGIVEPCIRTNQHALALDNFYRAVVACLKSYEAQRTRQERKLPQPSTN